MGLAKDEKEGPVVETNKAEGKVVQMRWEKQTEAA